MQIIALSGFARSGKDETAKVLVEKYGFKQIAFADKLREFLYAMNPMVDMSVQMKFHADMTYDTNRTFRYVQDVIDEYGWGGYKETQYGSEIRRLLQRLGTEAGRQTLWDTIWIDAALTGLDPDAKVVVSDARFFNEFDAVRSRGGEVWRIERPGVGPANDHASEMEAISYEFDRTIHNSRDLDYLHELVSNVYGDFNKLKGTVTAEAIKAAPKGGLSSAPIGAGNPLAPKKGDGSITSVNVPKKR